MGELLRTAEAAKRLHVEPETLRRWVKAGKITYIRMPSGQVRFRPEDVAQALVRVEPADGAA